MKNEHQTMTTCIWSLKYQMSLRIHYSVSLIYSVIIIHIYFMTVSQNFSINLI